MQRILRKIKPLKGFSHPLHILFKILLPVLVFILVRIDFLSLAIILILLSKWRLFAVRPRYWAVNVVSNGVDILVGISLAVFMANTGSEWWQLFWVAVYAGWLVWLKPRSDAFSVSMQALLGQLVALSAFYLKFSDISLLGLVAGTSVIAYVSARHFISSFDESHPGLVSNAWTYFAAGLAFVLGHWLLFYSVIAQITLFLTVIGIGVGTLYYLHKYDRLSGKIQRQIVGLLCAVLVIVLIFSNWTATPV